MAEAGVLGGSRDTSAPGRAYPQPRRAIWFPNWGMVSVLLVSVGLSVLALYLFSPDWFRLGRMLPIGLVSPLLADYSADPFALALPPVDARIIEEALEDQQDPEEGGVVIQLATLVDPLRSPVPSATPTSAAASTAGPTPSTGPIKSTATRTLAVTTTATITRTLTATLTAFPGIQTPTFTATSLAYQPSPTSGTIHTPTRTQPTATLPATAAATATPRPTSTPVPPATATPRPPSTATSQPYPPPPPPTEPAYP